MDYPASLSLERLEAQHPEYKRLAPTYQKIADLVEGGATIAARKTEYIPKRPGEEDPLYQIRIKRFTYTNILGQAIAAQVSKLSSGAVSIEGATDSFWEDFRAGNDIKRKRTEQQLLESVFRGLLTFGKVWLQVEKPKAIALPLNKLQEEQMGLNPYICQHCPRVVTDWGESDGQLQWVKLRQITEVAEPTKERQSIAAWTFIDDQKIVTYSAEVKFIGGEIREVKSGGEWKSTGKTEIPSDTPTLHGFRAIPIQKIEVPGDLWAGNSAYLIAMQALDLENSRYDSGIMTYVQRTWQPVASPDSDLDASYVDDTAPLKSGNQYLLKVGGFQFNEAGGSAIASIGAFIEELHDRIYSIFGQNSGSATKGAVQQSGASKKMDFVAQEVLLRAFGTIIIDAYEDVLRLVAIAAGKAERPSVSGLDSFDVDSLEAVFAIAVELKSIAPLLPPTAVKLFAKQLSGLLLKRTSSEQQAEIDAEIDAMFAAGNPLKGEEKDDTDRPKAELD
jgi:hypothetical protein